MSGLPVLRKKGDMRVRPSFGICRRLTLACGVMEGASVSSDHFSSKSVGPGNEGGPTARYVLEKDYVLSPYPYRIRSLSFFERVARVTAKCVAHWADRYHVHHRVRPISGINREGLLPQELDVRDSLIDSIVDSFLTIPDPKLEGIDYLCLDLYQGERLILNQGDGIIDGVLTVTSEQFRALQECWQRHDLPRDLYYPAHQRRVVMESVERGGKIISRPREFTPRQWARRSSTGSDES